MIQFSEAEILEDRPISAEVMYDVKSLNENEKPKKSKLDTPRPKRKLLKDLHSHIQ